MTDPAWLSAEEQLVWRDVVRLTRRVYAAMAKDLQESSGLSGADFEVLVALADRPDGRARAKDLVTDLEWDKSRLSHQLKRMETRGYLAREACPVDKRSAYLCVTELGHRMLATAAPSHVATVRRLIIDPVTSESVSGLTNLESLGRAARDLLARSEPPAKA